MSKQSVSEIIDSWETHGLQNLHEKDVCVMAFLWPHDLSRRVFHSAAISAGGLALSVCVMRLPGFVYLR